MSKPTPDPAAAREPDESYVRPYVDDDFDDEGFVLTCTRCGGEGVHEGDRPGWDVPGELVNCRACGGSGERRDQVVF